MGFFDSIANLVNEAKELVGDYVPDEWIEALKTNGKELLAEVLGSDTNIVNDANLEDLWAALDAAEAIGAKYELKKTAKLAIAALIFGIRAYGSDFEDQLGLVSKIMADIQEVIAVGLGDAAPEPGVDPTESVAGDDSEV